MPFFNDLNHICVWDFNEKYGRELTFLTNVMYLINTFPSLLFDERINWKLQEFLNYNIEYCSKSEKSIENSLLSASSILTLNKIYRKR